MLDELILNREARTISIAGPRYMLCRVISGLNAAEIEALLTVHLSLEILLQELHLWLS